ncbi:rhodanese-like domain-containing protein [Pedobacter sp. SYSU D00535]|uniref:rhodanese-like domain-containing protein n=1 Tax=Pedobacter sp. SYSU D00535 TaxID=2810308 RepID=UPI001A977E64|nr:rhodanese-like domain-containing protein [Pedobacter sp. SYSU D00535]
MKPLSNDISASELKEKLSNGVQVHIIDVREQLEFHTYNIGGLNIPLGTLGQELEELEFEKEEEIVMVCQRGLRSETARRLMAANGFINVRNLTGGLLAYRRTDL